MHLFNAPPFVESTKMPDPPVEVQPPSRFIANVSLPQKFDTKGNLAANWKKWLQVWKAYEIVTGLDKQPSSLRVATFITCIGPDALEIHTGLPFASEYEKESIQKLLELWQNYCIGETNVIYERYKFNNRSQEPEESIDAYTTALRTLADICEFGLLKEDLIRDRLVCGIRDNSLRKKLLQEPKLTLDKCLDSCRASQATKLQIQAMSSQNKESSEVNALKSSHDKPNARMVDDCKFCGKSHERNREKCPLTVKFARSVRKRITWQVNVTFMERKTTPRRRNQRHRNPVRRNPLERKCLLSTPMVRQKRKSCPWSCPVKIPM